jgi:hypothetical protein
MINITAGDTTYTVKRDTAIIATIKKADSIVTIAWAVTAGNVTIVEMQTILTFMVGL